MKIPVMTIATCAIAALVIIAGFFIILDVQTSQDIAISKFCQENGWQGMGYDGGFAVCSNITPHYSQSGDVCIDRPAAACTCTNWWLFTHWLTGEECGCPELNITARWC